MARLNPALPCIRQNTPVPLQVPLAQAVLEGDLYIPRHASGLVVFAHGSGSSRFSKRNRYVASTLNERRLGTLLIDLLTPAESREDEETAQLRFDIAMLAGRLAGITDWLGAQPELDGLPLGMFGASTGGGAALVAAAMRPRVIRAVVSRGGRPDLAGKYLPEVKAPTLLIVGGRDAQVITLNEQAQHLLNAVNELKIIPGATHLFEEPGALENVSRLAAEWFRRHLV